MHYIPGISFGNITFGMSVQEVSSIMGPDGVLEPAESGDVQLDYNDSGIAFHFFQEEDLVLSSIQVQRGQISIEFMEQDLFSLNYPDLLMFLSEIADETEHEIEYYEELGGIESIEFESLGLVLFFDSGKLLLEVTLFELTEDTGDEAE